MPSRLARYRDVRDNSGMKERLLDITCCPVTHQPLHKADRPLLESLNARIASGELVNAGGETHRLPLEQALVTRDGRRAYPVCDGLVMLLADAAFELGDGH